MKILLAVDGSPYTKKMLAYLGTHETLLSSFNNYTVFHAQPALPPRARAAVGKAIVDGYYTEESEKVLAPVAKFLLRHNIDAKSVWKVGPAGWLLHPVQTPHPPPRPHRSRSHRHPAPRLPGEDHPDPPPRTGHGRRQAPPGRTHSSRFVTR